jgi:hypothetical protein
VTEHGLVLQRIGGKMLFTKANDWIVVEDESDAEYEITGFPLDLRTADRRAPC